MHDIVYSLDQRRLSNLDSGDFSSRHFYVSFENVLDACLRSEHLILSLFKPNKALEKCEKHFCIYCFLMWHFTVLLEILLSL